MENRGKRLNKFIADSGYCSRREADRLIEEGRVRLNGRVGALGDRVEGGMAVSIGRLRPDTQYDYKFVCLSHNTLRGAAGGAVELAELLAAKGFMD